MGNGGDQRGLVVKRGPLQKWAGYAKGWRMRTFELTASGTLCYYRRPQDTKAAHSFSMDAVSRMRMTETNKGTGIELYLGEEQFLMVAKDRQDAHRWMFALQMVKGKAVATAADVADLQRQLEAIQELDNSQEAGRKTLGPSAMLSPSPAPMLSPSPASILSPTLASVTSISQSSASATEAEMARDCLPFAPSAVAAVPLTPTVISPSVPLGNVSVQSPVSGTENSELFGILQPSTVGNEKDTVSGTVGRGSLQLLSPMGEVTTGETERKERKEREKQASDQERERRDTLERERKEALRMEEEEQRETQRQREEEYKRERDREQEREEAREEEKKLEAGREADSEYHGDEDPFEEEEVLSPIELMQRHKRQASNQSAEPSGPLFVKSPPGTVHLLDTQWKSFQLRTMQLQALSRWANSRLPVENHFSSIETAFADGVNLCCLAASLTGKEVEGCNFSPAHTAFKHMNVNRAIMHLKECGYDLPGIPAHEIITGRLVTIVTLLWSIFSQDINSMGWAGKVGQKALLAWANEQATAFGVTVTNFRSSFQDGRAFYALLATRIPDQVNFALFSTSQRAELLDKAFGAAETSLSVPRLLDGTVCEGSDLDPVSVMMYVFMLFNAVRNV